jgi:tetratricopeptide (TPR) repeat protein
VLEGYVKKPPFTDQPGNREQARRLEAEAEAYADRLQQDGLRTAAAVYEAALERRPRDWPLRAMYSNLLLLGLDDPAAAEEQLRLVVRAMPRTVGPACQLGVLLREQGRLAESARLFEGVLDTGVESGVVHRDLGITYALDGQLERASRHLSRSLELSPRLLGTYLDLARVRARQGGLQGGVEVLRSALEVAPDQAVLHFALATFLQEQGQVADAVEQLRRTLALDPGHPGAAERLRQLEGVMAGAGAR